ncbi:PilW family protein [Noviherbaspirillum massiliense]|uniref:PilW family protein n=1 Tax=Noviherbaspirillum massiliense TaxID=1465823 RepID=UPI00031783EC|nr:PilW family protein [Noviherbaspirillum massiliense]
MTLVELMISITLGLLVVLATTALLLSAKSGYLAQEDGIRIQESGRYAIEVLTRAIRQAAYENWDGQTAPVLATEDLSAYIIGLDAASLKSTTPGIESALAKSVNGSDVLAVRFFGSGAGPSGDGTMINCAGYSVPAVISQDRAEDDRGWSIFYVAEDASGEPELYCKYKGSSSWSSQAIVRGVESFQVLYGIDADGDGLPERFLNAVSLHALDDALVLDGPNAAARAIDGNRKTNWTKVVAVRITLLIRGAEAARTDVLDKDYDLFGKDYSDAHAGSDIGTRISELRLPKATRNRIRKIFATSILLRNRPVGSPA